MMTKKWRRRQRQKDYLTSSLPFWVNQFPVSHSARSGSYPLMYSWFWTFYFEDIQSSPVIFIFFVISNNAFKFNLTLCMFITMFFVMPLMSSYIDFQKILWTFYPLTLGGCGGIWLPLAPSIFPVIGRLPGGQVSALPLVDASLVACTHLIWDLGPTPCAGSHVIPSRARSAWVPPSG